MTEAKEKAYISWDTCDITEGEVEYRQETWKEHYPEEDSCPDEDTIRNDIYNDPMFYEWQWDSMTDDLGNHMEEINPKGKWTASVTGQGWQNRSGEMPEFHTTNPTELLQKILPDCEKTFYIYRYEINGIQGLKIVCHTHDSPMGELYYVLPVDKDFEKIAEMINDGSFFSKITPIDFEEEVLDEVSVI